MAVLIPDAKKGIRRHGPWATLTAAVATAVTIFTLAAGTMMIGNKSVRLMRVYLLDGGTGGTLVHIGTGQAGLFVEQLAIPTVDGMGTNVAEDDLPMIEFFANPTAYSDALTVQILIEVEEIG